ncbi:MAG: ABC transporter substrate-binding protein [Elusimicrobia bacterium]|nr:ABC transporter substrate-binding protein [Elusimicrobiota bacterium]
MSRKPHAAALSVLTLLLPAALGLASPARAADDPATLRYALTSEVDSLDPDWAYDATSLFAIQQMYESLVDFDGGALDRFAPRLASVVPTRENGFLSKDGLLYRFPLRAGVKFHDGTPLTAEDVKYSLMRFLLTTGEGGPSNLLLEPLTGRRSALGPDGKPDPAVYDLADQAVYVEGGALVIRLPKPFAPLLSVLAGSAQIVSKSYVMAHGGWNGTKADWARTWSPSKVDAALYERENGTGPFRLSDWDRGAKTLLLARNDAYWRAPAPLPAARLVTVEQPKTRREMLERGEIDVAQLNTRSLPYFQAVKGAVVETRLPLLQADDVIFFNEKIEPKDNPWLGSGQLDGQGVPPDFFADADVRRGFASAFDDDGYIRDAFHGSAVRARGPIPPALLSGNLPPPQTRPYSLDDAARALRAARGGAVWENGFTLPMAYPEGDSERLQACRTLQAGLARVNARFRVDCRGVPQTKLIAELGARRLSAFVYRWILDYPDPHNAVEPFLGSRGYFASALGYSNSRADALIEAALAESDPAKRKADYLELEALAAYDVPALFTVQTNGALALRKNVQNWVYHPMTPYGSLYEVTKIP